MGASLCLFAKVGPAIRLSLKSKPERGRIPSKHRPYTPRDEICGCVARQDAFSTPTRLDNDRLGPDRLGPCCFPSLFWMVERAPGRRGERAKFPENQTQLKRSRGQLHEVSFRTRRDRAPDRPLRVRRPRSSAARKRSRAADTPPPPSLRLRRDRPPREKGSLFVKRERERETHAHTHTHSASARCRR